MLFTRFYELDVTCTLQENLENKTIIEFPTIYVILKDHSYAYEIIDTGMLFIYIIIVINVRKFDTKLDNVLDDEAVYASNCESSNNILRKKKRKFNEIDIKEEKTSTVNYFFNSDTSEPEDEKMNDNCKAEKLPSFKIPYYDELVKTER